MASLIDHIIKLTDHRDRDRLEMALSKALIDLLAIQRVVVAHAVSHHGQKRWLDIARLDAKGGGKMVDPLRTDFAALPAFADAKDRIICLQAAEMREVAWAGENGPRIHYFPLFDVADHDIDTEGVIEVHAPRALTVEDVLVVEQLRQTYRNMFRLLAYSERDPLTGLLNRKSLDDAFYSVVLEELDGVDGSVRRAAQATATNERRHRLPANSWLGLVMVDPFTAANDALEQRQADEVRLLVARNMTSTFRTYDLIYRFDGERFGVLMYCPDEAVVLSVFERFRAKVEKLSLPQLGAVTVSCGFTPVLTDDTPVTAMDKTQRAVDQARHQGGNRVLSQLALARDGQPDAAEVT